MKTSRCVLKVDFGAETAKLTLDLFCVKKLIGMDDATTAANNHVN